MLEQELKNLAEVMSANTQVMKQLIAVLESGVGTDIVLLDEGLELKPSPAVDVNATHGEKLADVVEEKPKKKPRRTKAQIAADKQAKQDALDAEASNTPPPPPSASDDPKVGRTIHGLAVPEDVDVGMEQGWYDYSPEGIAHAQSVVESEVLVETMTIDDMRTQLAALGATKGGMAIVFAISKYGKKIEDVSPTDYVKLLAEITSAPDVGTAPTPPAA